MGSVRQGKDKSLLGELRWPKDLTLRRPLARQEAARDEPVRRGVLGKRAASCQSCFELRSAASRRPTRERKERSEGCRGGGIESRGERAQAATIHEAMVLGEPGRGAHEQARSCLSLPLPFIEKFAHCLCLVRLLRSAARCTCTIGCCRAALPPSTRETGRRVRRPRALRSCRRRASTRTPASASAPAW